MDTKGSEYHEYLDQARGLVAEIESGNLEQANERLDGLARLRESMLFQELGKITRELHNTLGNFQVDTKLCSLTESDIPDAKERLNYVITLTEQAADKTLSVVEQTIPRTEELEARALALKSQWDRFRSRDMNVDEFRGLTQEIDDFLCWATDNAVHINSGLSDIMMTQSFQDLTGQIIRRVITMVQEVEDNLVGLIRLTGQYRVVAERVNDKEGRAEAIKAEGPAIPGLKKSAQVVNSQDEVDDLLSSLGF